MIRSVVIDGHRATVIAAREDIGVLYGAFHFLRLVQTGQPLAKLDLRESPHLKLRVLNHWDNLDRTSSAATRAQSIWDWHKLPRLPRSALHRLRARQRVARHQRHGAQQRQRQCAQPHAGVSREGRGAGRRVAPVRHPGLPDARASARPIEIGGLKTADPLDPGSAALVEAPRPTRSTASFPTSAASSSRPIPKASRARRTTAAPTPTAPTCWPTRWRRTAAS